MQVKLTSALVFAATASALQVTSPSRGDEWDLTGSNDISWDSVESDPSSFDIQLVNEHVNPPVVKTIATNVQTSAGSYSFSNVAAAAGNDYQINFVSNDEDNTGILAQSAQFDVTDAVGSSSSSSLSSTTSSSSTSTGSSSQSTDTTTTSTKSGSSSTSSSSFSSIRTSSSTSASKTATATTSGASATHTGAAAAISISIMGCVLGSAFALFL